MLNVEKTRELYLKGLLYQSFFMVPVFSLGLVAIFLNNSLLMIIAFFLMLSLLVFVVYNFSAFRLLNREDKKEE